jgi:hypothetical protein
MTAALNIVFRPALFLRIGATAVVLLFSLTRLEGLNSLNPAVPRIVSLALLALPLIAQPRIHVAGSVRAGETFRKDITSGLNLVLPPNDSPDSGWTIEVQPADKSDDFMRCLNLPIHGPTQADILASQFVSDENERLPESALADQKKREFQFVLNAVDQKKACDELDVIAYSPPKTAEDGTVIVGTPGYKDPPLGSVTFLIRNVRLSDVGKGKQARLDSMSFEADITFPTSQDRGRETRK